VHHFADQVIDFLNRNHNFGLDIAISREEDMLLDTGGGLKKAAWFFDDQQPFLVHNVDVISDLDYNEMLSFHNQTKSLATLAVAERETSRYLLFDNAMQLCGWENTLTTEVRMIRQQPQRLEQLAFSGIHILDPSVFGLINQSGKFSIVDAYLQLGALHKISGFRHDATHWADMGKPADLLKAQHILEKLKKNNPGNVGN
jgi:NDP-sugar pyrophosphorylase family protein